MKDNLQKLFPQETKVKFKNVEREFTVGKITLADDAWMLNEFGGKEGLTQVFARSDIRAMVRILYRLLSLEDKRFITDSVGLTTVDEDGKETVITSNIDKLIYMLSSEDVEAINFALMKSRGASMPDIEEGDEGKKKKLKK